MIRKANYLYWGVLFGVFVALTLFIGQTVAQGDGVLGEGPDGLRVVVAEGVGGDTAVIPPTPAANQLILGTLTPRAYIPIVVKPILCPTSVQAQGVAALAMNDPEQQRVQMICDPILSQVAAERALDLGTRDYFSHTNPDGFGPNYLVEQAGYNLPDWYGSGLTANNIESISAGTSRDTAVQAWASWTSSGAHRPHVLGLDAFWREQIYYGIGYAYVPGSTYTHYWVFISAP